MLKEKLKQVESQLVPLDEIDFDSHPEIQSRADGLSEEVVKEYMEKYEPLRGLAEPPKGMDEFSLYDSTGMPRLQVVTPDNATFWLASGFHRRDALERIGCKVAIPVDVFNGNLVDAQYLSMTANKSHGLRRTNADKRKAAVLALNHPWTHELSDRAIADEIGVSHIFVGTIRKELQNEDTRINEESKSTGNGFQLEGGKNSLPSTPAKRVGKDGKARKAPPARRPAESVPDSGADEFLGRSRRRKSRLDKHFEPTPEKSPAKPAKKTAKKTVAKALEFVSVEVSTSCEYTAWNSLVGTLGADWFRRILSVRPSDF